MAAFLRSFQLNELWNRLIHDGAFIFLQQTFLDTKRQRDPPALRVFIYVYRWGDDWFIPEGLDRGALPQVFQNVP